MTIQVRLSFWYMGVSLAILLVFSLTTYSGMRHLLYSALERERELIMEAIQARYDPLLDRFQSLGEFQYSTDGHMHEIYLIVYDSLENAVYRSPLAEKMRFSIPLVRTTIEEQHTLTMPIGEVRKFKIDGSTGTTFRAVSRKIYHQQQFVGWISLALPVGEIEDSMHTLLKILLLGIVFTVVLIGGASYLLTRQALHPVAVIAQKARRISSRNLDERLEVENEHDELGQLAIVLNGLLDRLQKAFQSQRQFMADAAHELKTPLTVLRAHWEDELNNPKVPHAVKEKLVQDVESISRLSRMINSLLLLSQTEGLRQLMERKPVRLDLLAEEVTADLMPLAETREQKITVHTGQQVEILGDRDRIYQLMFNLLDNASKYSYEGAEIGVTLAVAGGHAEITVHDSGPGISAEHLPHIFERFYRVDKDRSRKTGGSGLGLAICKFIAESHGGTISVESEAGAGATFRVRLPLA